MPIVLRNPPRADLAIVAGFAELGVATVHEAQGRSGLLSPRLRPILSDTRIAGTAVTVSTAPGDNWMIHVAIEQCQPGDVLVVAPTSRCEDGYLGELIATALQVRGVRGVIIDGGCRDIAELRRMRFPVWAANVSATGTVKATLGDVNLPVVCAGQFISPGDVIVADDDGVVVVSRQQSLSVLVKSRERDQRELLLRERYRRGELSLDVGGMRAKLKSAGLQYLDSGERPE